MSTILKPPRLRSATDERERRATWFELFFDLVFVLAITELSQHLQRDASFIGFARFVGLFVPVWWAWVVYTTYADRFDTDDVIYRALMILAMLAIAAMATAIPDAFGSAATRFVISYLLVRAVPLILYLRAARHEQQGRRLARIYARGTTMAATLWLISLLLPTPTRYILWAVAVGIELGIPIAARRSIAATPMSTSHITERFGLFTIIVLGEAVVSVGSGLAQTRWHPSSAVAAGGAFVMAGCLWWIYFELAQRRDIQRRFLVREVYVYGHLPIAMGITAAAAGAKLVVEQAGHSALPTGTAWALCGGIGLYVIALSTIRMVLAEGTSGRAEWAGLVAAVLVLGLAVAHRALSLVVLVSLLVAILIAQVAISLVLAGRQARLDDEYVS